MSVLIKGMEMPKNCDECPLLTKDGDYDVCFVGKRRVMWGWKYDRGSEVIHPKPDWCPIIEVPPHGRLIDADALMLRIQEYIDEYGWDVDEHGFHSEKWCAMKETEMAINDAPTVIPADKDGET